MALTQASEGGLKISNAGTNGQFLQKQSGNTGGLTWATVSSGSNVGGSSGVDFNDNVKVRLGTGNDLQIYHDGSNSYIHDAGTGQLRVSSSNFKVYNAAQSETIINAVENGAVSLYYDNSKKFETTSTGASMDGLLNFNNSGDKILLPDSGKIILGGGLDLQIYHDGSNSIIDNNTNDLIIRADGDDLKLLAEDDIVLRDNDDSTNFIHCINGGAVELFHNGNKKFETHQYGVDISGNVYIGDSGEGKLLVGAGEDLQIFHDGSHNYLVGSTGDIILKNSSANYFKGVTATGAVELYHNNAKKFETSSSGVTLPDGLHLDNPTNAGRDVQWQPGSDRLAFFDNVKATWGDGVDLQIYHDGGSSWILNNLGHLYIRNNVDGDDGSNIYIQPKSGEGSIAAIHDGGVYLYYDGTMMFETVATGSKVHGKLEVTDDLNLTGAATNALWDKSANEFKLNDNTKLALGSDGDAKLYNTGSKLWLDVFNNHDFGISLGAGNEYSAEFKANSSVDLYYDNAKKFATTADGIDVTGGTYTGQILLRTADGAQRGRIYSTNGSDTFFQSGHNETYLKYVYDGGVELYFNNSKVAETDTNGIQFDDGKGLTFGTDNDLTVKHSSTDTTFLMTPAGVVNFNFDGNDSTTGVCLRIQKTGDAANNVRHNMFSFGLPGVNRGNAQCGSSNSEAPIWVASSDYRIKENFRTYTGGWDAIKAIPVQLYDEKSPSYWAQGSDQKDLKGWKAHDVQAVIPEAVTGTKDAVVTQAMIDAGEYQQSELGHIVPQQLGTTAMIPTVIGALQQAMAKIDLLEEKVAALEAA